MKVFFDEFFKKATRVLNYPKTYYAEAYLEPNQTSKMELFVQIVIFIKKETLAQPFFYINNYTDLKSFSCRMCTLIIAFTKCIFFGTLCLIPIWITRTDMNKKHSNVVGKPGNGKFISNSNFDL